MGYLTQSSAIVANASEMLDTIYSSSFTQFIQGMGQPVLCEVYNYNASLSSVQDGTGDIDHIIGRESPIRYNYIPNMPIYGMNRDLLPQINQGEGALLDMDMELEVTVLPNVYRPQPYDHLVYRFGPNNSRVVLFRVNNITIGSIRNNDYYKVNLHMVDIDDETDIIALNKQVVKTFVVDLDRVGTNENCLIEDVVYRKCDDVDKLIADLCDEYRTMFYSERYNAVLYQEGQSRASYDPHLNNFIINTHMLEKERNSITMVVFDQGVEFREEYTLTFYRALETGKAKYICRDLHWQPVNFSRKNVNPFAYYGLDYVYKVHVYEDEDNANEETEYQNYRLLQHLDRRTPDGLPAIEKAIVKYLMDPEDLGSLFDDDQLDELQMIRLKYDKYYYEFIPMVVFLLRKYTKALRDAQ